MIDIQKNERILLSLHRHWIAFAGKLLIIFFLSIGPLIILSFLSASVSELVIRVAAFLSAVYYLIIFFIAFVFWVDYYLDMWIVTDRRIIDVEQTGLFKREVSEFMIFRVQDVTIEIPNFMATVFNYGNIIVQTAGEKSFSIRSIPHPDKAKKIILEYATKAQVKL